MTGVSLGNREVPQPPWRLALRGLLAVRMESSQLRSSEDHAARPAHLRRPGEDHATLIVALDGGDLAGAERGRAEALVESCAGCAALRADLTAIRGALVSLPVPPRRRDFQLSPEDASRLRPTAWRRLLGWLAAPGSTVRPLATGLATLGVVGLLLTVGLPGLGVGGARPP